MTLSFVIFVIFCKIHLPDMMHAIVISMRKYFTLFLIILSSARNCLETLGFLT